MGFWDKVKGLGSDVVDYVTGDDEDDREEKPKEPSTPAPAPASTTPGSAPGQSQPASIDPLTGGLLGVSPVPQGSELAATAPDQSVPENSNSATLQMLYPVDLSSESTGTRPGSSPDSPDNSATALTPEEMKLFPGLQQTLQNPEDKTTSAVQGLLPNIAKIPEVEPGRTATFPGGATVNNSQVRLPNGLTGIKSEVTIPGVSEPVEIAPGLSYSPQQLAGLFSTDDSYTVEQRDRDLALLNGPRTMGPYTAAALAAEAAAKAAATERLNAHWNQKALQGGADGSTVVPGLGYSPTQLANDLSLAGTRGNLDEASERLRQEARDRLNAHAYTKQSQDEDQLAAYNQYLPFDDPRRVAEVQRYIDSGLTPDQAQNAVWRNAVDARNRLILAGIPLLDSAQVEQLDSTPRAYTTDPRRQYIPNNSPFEGKPHDFTEAEFRNLLGDLTGLNDLSAGLENGDYGQAAIGGLWTLLNFTPGVFFKPAMAGFRSLGRWADEIPAAAGPPAAGLGNSVRVGYGGQEAGEGASVLYQPWDSRPGVSGYVPEGSAAGIPEQLPIQVILPDNPSGVSLLPEHPAGGRPSPMPEPPSNPTNARGTSPAPAEQVDLGYSMNGQPSVHGPAVSPWRQPPPNVTRPWDPDYQPFGWGQVPDRRPGWYRRYGRSDEPGAHNGPQRANNGHGPDSETVPYTGPSHEAPPGVLPVGVREVGEGSTLRWYDENVKGFVSMPEWAKVPPNKYAKAQHTPEEQFSLTPGARAKISEVQAARNEQDIVVDGLRAERDKVARELGLDPDKLTDKYLDGQRLTLERKYSLAEIQHLENAMSAVNKAEYQANKLTETMGNIAARDYIHQMGGEVITGLDDAVTGAGKLDVVGIVGGKLVVVEAKGGGAHLGTRLVTGEPGQMIRVQQGTPQYLKWMLDNDPELVKALKDRGLLETVRNGEMEVVYDLVRYNPKVGNPQWARFNIEDIPAVPSEAIQIIPQPGLPAAAPAAAVPQASEIAAPPPWLESAAQSVRSTLNAQIGVAAPVLGAVAAGLAGGHSRYTAADQSLTVNISAPVRPIGTVTDRELYQFLTYGSGIRV